MKRLKVLALTLATMASTLYGEALRYNISVHPYTFSTYFEMEGEHGYLGKVVKNWSQIRETYEFYNAQGQYDGRAEITAHRSDAPLDKRMEIFDAQGESIGIIQSRDGTTSKACFDVINQLSRTVGSAYLDNNCTNFALLDPDSKVSLALYKRHYIDGISDDWNVTLFHSDCADLRVLKALSVFAADYQGSFNQ